MVDISGVNGWLKSTFPAVVEFYKEVVGVEMGGLEQGVGGEVDVVRELHFDF